METPSSVLYAALKDFGRISNHEAALERLARRLGAEWKLDKARKGERAAGPGVLLIKPTTFMNCSGECVGPIMRYYKF